MATQIEPREAATMSDDPATLVDLPLTAKFSIPQADLDVIQLRGLQQRFDDLVHRIPVLARFAEEQNLSRIERIEDGALLLFPHTIYKSYPLSGIEKGRYDQMSRWLGSLTAIDTAAVDCDGCDSIDDWIERFDTQTDLRVRHSSGTTGKLSFIPQSRAEAITSVRGIARALEPFGNEPGARDGATFGDLPLIAFGYRHGSQSFPRSVAAIIEHFYGGGENRVLCLDPGRISADMASLAGRLEGAQARGAVGRVALSPGLMARREAFLREQEEAPRHREAFFDALNDTYRGQRVILKGVLPPTVGVAVEGLARGLEGLFARDSIFFVAGGAKGQNLPDDYREQVERFTGLPFPAQGYGMSEAASAITLMCPHGHYHIVPNLIPYLVDPDSGVPLPRKGRQTGRLGILDIACETRWGGFLTGDEVTLDFGDATPCGCGRRGAYIAGEIRRYSEIRGGDDKITCAGAPGLNDRALDFMSKAGS
ncbi:hypothetical protein [Novosphingobium lentum]|uniref:hypothetical protein n=1 Tax=Novosphingobium lentum TaxID=145287 RepID=UPI00082BC9D9|nr:hypothetical protein [Novosphingobium lentum]